MNDVPVSPSTDQSGDAGPASSVDAWTWWMAPARLVGRFRPWVRAAAAADAAALRGLPKVAVVVGLPLLVVVLAGIVNAFHATSQIANVSPQVDWLRFQIDDVFTESPLFLLGAVAIGAFSPALAVFFVVVFGFMDLAAAASQGNELLPLPGALAGRLIALWLLWLLVVEIPILGRQLGLSWQRLAENRFAVAALTALATGAFVWIWTQAATVLVRPLFTWSSLPGVRLEAIQPVQTAGLAFAIAGGLVAGAVAFARGPAGLLHAPLARPAQPASRGPLAVLRRLAGRVVVAALLTVSLGGLISVPLEAVALFAALAGAGPLARFVADRTALGTIVRAVPPIARYAVAGALTFAVAQVTIAPLYTLAAFDSSGTVPQFFSVIVAVVIGMFVARLATTPASRGRRRESTLATMALVAAIVAGTSTMLLLAAPLPVYADNCASLADCWGTPFVAALAGGALSLFMAAFDQTPPVISELSAFAGEEGAKAQGDYFESLKNKAAFNAMNDGDNEEYSRIKNLSNSDFGKEVAAGKHK